MVKIKNKRNLKAYLKDYDSGIITQELAAKYLGITPRWFRQIYKLYIATGSIPGTVYPIMSVICGHGAQFYANK